METTMYLCEFFFTDFWHWLGGRFYLGAIFSVPLLSVNIGKGKKDKEE